MTRKIIGCILTLLCHSFVWAQSSPIPMLENAATQIIANLKTNKATLKSNPQIVQQTVERHLLPIVDVNGMSRSVLGAAAWNKASAADRQAFSKAFTQLVIRTYASPLSEYSDETVKFLPVRGSIDGRFVRANSIIIRPSGQKIPLSYSLVSIHDQWKIYDFSVEGVSLLQSFRTQFGQVLKNSNMETLLTQMRQKKAA